MAKKKSWRRKRKSVKPMQRITTIGGKPKKRKTFAELTASLKNTNQH